MTAPDDPFRKQPEPPYAPPGGAEPPGGYGSPAGSGYGSPAGSGYGAPAGAEHGASGAGYGSPAGGGWGGPPAPRSNGLAIGALVTGVLALLSSITILGGIVLGIVAVVLGIVALRRARRGAGGGVMAGIGIALGALGLLIPIGLIAFGLSVLGSDAGQSLQECLQQAAGDPNAEQECAVEFEDSLTGG